MRRIHTYMHTYKTYIHAYIHAHTHINTYIQALYVTMVESKHKNVLLGGFNYGTCIHTHT